MARRRFAQPKMATMSPMPVAYALRETVETYNNVVAHLPARVERGRGLFLQMLAGLLRERLQARAPRVTVAGKEYDYAQDLRIALVSGAPRDMDAVAIYFESQVAELAAAAAGRTALYVLPRRGSPPWAGVLRRWGPWPADLLPVRVDTGDARLIARSARPDEIRALTRRLMAQRAQIVADLAAAGAPDVRLERTDNAVGARVQSDLAHAVLRREFGMDGAQPVAHWRPALREVLDAVPAVLRRFERYLVTGRASAFVLPDIGDQITMNQLREGRPFMEELAPFVPHS